MTRIQSKAPPIQHLPARERPSGEPAGRPFKDVLNPKPGVEPSPHLGPTSDDTQASARDSMPSQTHAQQGWIAPSRTDHEHSLVHTATVVQSPASVLEQPAHASASPGLDRTQADEIEGLVKADQVAETVGLVVEPAVTSMVFSAGSIALPVPSQLSNVGASVEPPIEAPSDVEVFALGEGVSVASHVFEDAPLAHEGPSSSSPGTASLLATRQAMPADAKGALLSREDETAIEVPTGMWCELPAQFETSRLSFSTALPESAPPQIQFPAQTQPGMGPDQRDGILRPWRLQASGGLSYLSSGVQTGAPAETSLLTGRISDGLGSRIPSPSADVSEGGSLPVRWKSVLRLPVELESFSRRMESDGHVSSDPIEAKSGQLVALAHWSQRMLRWSGNAASAGITAWVRDYLLSESDLPALIDALVALSIERGISLARIVVNGHEAWSAEEQHTMRGNHDGR